MPFFGEIPILMIFFNLPKMTIVTLKMCLQSRVRAQMSISSTPTRIHCKIWLIICVRGQISKNSQKFGIFDNFCGQKGLPGGKFCKKNITEYKTTWSQLLILPLKFVPILIVLLYRSLKIKILVRAWLENDPHGRRWLADNFF